MKTETPKLSAEAEEKAAELGRRCAKEDGWIRPSNDEEGEDMADYGNFAQAHRSGWEQTNQFQCIWLEQLIAITEPDAGLQGVHRDDNNMLWYEAFQVPAKEAFWEAWAEEVKLEEFWQEHYQPCNS